MPKFKVRVLADATVYKEVVVEADKPANALSKALSASELDGRPWLLSDGFQADQPYIGDADNDWEPVDEAVPDVGAEGPPEVPPGYKLVAVGDIVAPGYLVCFPRVDWARSRGFLAGRDYTSTYLDDPAMWIANPVDKLVRLERGEAKARPRRPRPRKPVKSKTAKKSKGGPRARL